MASARAEATGSVNISRPAKVNAVAGLPPEADLEYARAAIVDVLNRGGNDTTVPWENPQSGARGTVTPLAAPYARDGATCHNFLASHVQRNAEVWLQGEACRAGKTAKVDKAIWEVKSLRPWRRT